MKKAVWIALGLALAVFIVRMALALGTSAFSVDDSYFHLRQAEHIQQTGAPLFDDPLSFGGRTTLFAPAYDYALAGVGFIFGIPLAAKVLTNLSAAVLVVLVYAFAQETTRDWRASLIAALAAGLVPVLWQGLVSASAPSLSIVFGLAMLLCFLRLDLPQRRGTFLALIIAGSIITPSFTLFILGLLVYLLLAVMADVQRPRGEHELVFFSVLFALWSALLFFKRLFVAHGLAVFWQNIPTSILAAYFSHISVLDAVAAVGVVPFVAGMYVMYRHLFKEQERSVYLVMGLVLATGLLVWLRLLRPEFGLEVLGIALVLLFAFALARLLRYVDRTKFTRWSPWIAALAGVLVLVLSGISSFHEGQAASANALTIEERDALDWLRTDTASDSVVLATLEEGHAIEERAQRGTIADTNFLLKDDAAIRIEDIHRAFTSPFDSDIVTVMERYGARYVLWTSRTRVFAGTNEPLFARNTDCFPAIFTSGTITIYERRCGVRA
ncbi:MAG TPA: hypothetical protein VLJ21_02895 [Candidatus Binatia bacterium]|nr:hypothetical protein [Candidatus Binatia bacterium]